MSQIDNKEYFSTSEKSIFTGQRILHLSLLLLNRLCYCSTFESICTRVACRCVLWVASPLCLNDLTVWVHLYLGACPETSELELHLLYFRLWAQDFLQVWVLAIWACLSVLVHDGRAVQADVLVVSCTFRKAPTWLLHILRPILGRLRLLKPAVRRHLCCNLVLAFSLFLSSFLNSITEFYYPVLVIFRPCIL